MKKRAWLYLAIFSISLPFWFRLGGSTEYVALESSGSVLSESVPLFNVASKDVLPIVLNRTELDRAFHDPFAPAPSRLLPTPYVPLTGAPSPSSPPTPALNVTFTGHLIAPNGTHSVFVKSGNESITLMEGLVLPTGYRVRTITKEAVEFDHLTLSVHAHLEIPPAPYQEIR